MRVWKSLKVLTLVEVRNMFRNKMPLIFNLVAPVSFMLLFGLIYSPSASSPLGVPGAVPGLATAAPARLIDQLIPGILTFMLLNANLTGVAHTVVSQRQSGVLRHMFSTPLSPSVWLSARILSHLILGLIQLALVMAVGVLVFGASVPTNWLNTLLVLIVCTLAPLSIGLLLGTAFRRLETAQPFIMMSAVILPFLGGAFLPLSQAPAAMQRIGVFIPASQMVDSLKLVVVQGESLATAAAPLGILALWTAFCLTLGARVLRRQTTVT